jgi:radical SAM enzyme (TIGR01210 family)
MGINIVKHLQNFMIRDAEILNARHAKNTVDPFRPYAFLVEPECSSSGTVVDVATIFLTNRECPFRCLMCDLWKNTLDQRVPIGAIPQQIDFALSRLSPARQIKLYNSGNFFDAQAIPFEDHAQIAKRVSQFDNVIVENHPKLCGPSCAEFRELLQTNLEVAIGLETAHEPTLRALNKSMTLDDFKRAVHCLQTYDIAVRAFILLKPPLMSEQQGMDWAIRSIEFAFSLGVQCCSVIPTRGGNGIMEQLGQQGLFALPRLSSLETVLEQTIDPARGRVFVDLWDAERFSSCPDCQTARIDRLHQMNLTQTMRPSVVCYCQET